MHHVEVGPRATFPSHRDRRPVRRHCPETSDRRCAIQGARGEPGTLRSTKKTAITTSSPIAKRDESGGPGIRLPQLAADCATSHHVSQERPEERRVGKEGESTC